SRGPRAGTRAQGRPDGPHEGAGEDPDKDRAASECVAEQGDSDGPQGAELAEREPGEGAGRASEPGAEPAELFAGVAVLHALAPSLAELLADLVEAAHVT